ncbi:MAG: toll/interleukin-1 receptor domain-containing protein [Phycisphaerales bacterium]|nr:toll/interleukin-1 receptor domain-containing protein [Hyphomonadaceae bacterium]
MADIFVSYSRLDQERVKPIVDRLISLGYSVWWPEHAPSQKFIDQTQGELDQAKAVLTVWSVDARNSTWVAATAAHAWDQGKLAQVRIDGVDIPAPFGALPVADMRGSGEWGPLGDALERIARDGAGPQPANGEPSIGALAAPAAAGAPKVVTIAIGTTLAAFMGAVTATINGAMTSGQLQLALTGMLGVGAVCAAISAHRLYAIRRAGG